MLHWKEGKRRENESSAFLCVEALKMCLHGWSDVPASRPNLLPTCIKCDVWTQTCFWTVTVAKGQPVHQQRVRLIPGWWPCHTSHKTLAKGRRWAAWCLQRHRGEPTATGWVGYFNRLAVGWLFLMEEQLLLNKIFTGWAVTRGNCLSPESDKQGPLLHTFPHLSVWCCWGSGGSGLAPCVILSSPKPSLPVGLQLWACIWCLLHLVPGRGGCSTKPQGTVLLGPHCSSFLPFLHCFAQDSDSFLCLNCAWHAAVWNSAQRAGHTLEVQVARRYFTVNMTNYTLDEVCFCIAAPATQAILQVMRRGWRSLFCLVMLAVPARPQPWGCGCIAEESRSGDRSCLWVPSCHRENFHHLSQVRTEVSFQLLFAFCSLVSKWEKVISQKPSMGTDSPAKCGEKKAEGRSYRCLPERRV